MWTDLVRSLKTVLLRCVSPSHGLTVTACHTRLYIETGMQEKVPIILTKRHVIYLRRHWRQAGLASSETSGRYKWRSTYATDGSFSITRAKLQACR